MYTPIYRGPMRRQGMRHFLFHKRANGVCLMVAKQTQEPLGVRIDFYPHDYAGVATSYFTRDNGRTFHYLGVESTPETSTWTIGDEQNDPEIVSNLRGLLDRWNQGFYRDLAFVPRLSPSIPQTHRM